MTLSVDGLVPSGLTSHRATSKPMRPGVFLLSIDHVVLLCFRSLTIADDTAGQNGFGAAHIPDERRWLSSEDTSSCPGA